MRQTRILAGLALLALMAGAAREVSAQTTTTADPTTTTAAPTTTTATTTTATTLATAVLGAPCNTAKSCVVVRATGTDDLRCAGVCVMGGVTCDRDADCPVVGTFCATRLDGSTACCKPCGP